MSSYFNPADDQAALLSLAKTMKRLAHQYKRWALEDEAAGKLAAYRKHRAESDRCWRNAHWYLDFARNRRAA